MRRDTHPNTEPLLCEVNHARGHPEWFPVSKGDMKSVTVDGMRYLRNGDGSVELYNIQDDYWEQKNLADEESYRGTLGRFEEFLERVMQKGVPDASSESVSSGHPPISSEAGE